MNDRIPALDGLRAIAIALVVALHYQILPGGWVGVDVFFVLSGWLITSILLHEHDLQGGIALTRFYVRRAGRLYPALMLAIALHFLVSCRDYSMRSLTWDAVAAVTYTMDFVQGFGHVPQGWIGHTWSLAVEEQFYLLWPLALIAGVRWRRLGVAVAAAFGAVASLAVMASAPGDPWRTPAYFHPWTRAWELLAGCALAALGWHLRCQWARVAGPAALALLAGSVWFAGRFGAPSGLRLAAGALLGVVATMAILMVVVGAPESITSRLLSLSPLRWIGERSYGIYLFEPPLGFASREILPHGRLWLLVGLCITVGVAAGVVSMDRGADPANGFATNRYRQQATDCGSGSLTSGRGTQARATN